MRKTIIIFIGIVFCKISIISTSTLAQNVFSYWVPYVDTKHVGNSVTYNYLSLYAFDDNTLPLHIEAEKPIQVTKTWRSWWEGISESTFGVTFLGRESKTVNQPPPIYPTAGTLQTAGQEFWLDIHIGDSLQPVTNLFGVSLDLVYATKYLDVVESAAGSLLSSNVIFFPRNDDAAGRITLAITRKAGAGGVTGNGVVARVKFISSANTPDCTPVRFIIDSLKAIDPNNNPIPLTPGSLSVTIRPPLDFTVRAVPETLCVIAGQSASFTASLSANCAFDTMAVLTANFPPSAVDSVIFKPAIIDTCDTATATIFANKNAPADTYKIIVSATAKGVVRRDTVTLCIKPPPNFTLRVEPDSLCIFAGDSAVYQVHLVSNETFQAKVGLSGSIQPAGPRLSFTPDSLAGTTTGKLIIGTDKSTSPGFYTITVTGTGVNLTHADTVILRIKIPPAFTLRVKPDSLCIVTGDSATYQVHLVSNETFQANVDLSASIQPPGATLLLNPAFLTGTAMGSLIVRTDRNTTPGYYTIIVTGTGGGSTRADTVSLCVKPLDFEIVVTPESHEIVAGETASYQIRLRVIGDFNASVRLSVSGHPAGREPSFERNPISPADSTTLTIYTEPTTPVQLYFLIITGEGGGSVHRDTVTLRVKEPPDFALQVDPATQTVKVGETALYRISIVPIAGFKDSVALAIADLSVPTRTTVELKPDVITPGQDSKLTIPTSSQAQLGTYAFKVIGKSQLLTHDTTATIIIIIEQIAGVLPNPFTPNSDGFNDFVTFNVQGLLESGGEVIIYNFRGRKVRELSGENRWDGKSDNGEDLPFGMYLYIVKVDGKVKASGSLTLIR